ncbi:MAG: MFS transporter [Lachnospiraceae bacterium]|nr:MFS transporter [Lachnospiraceae bacterium]
MKKLTRKSQIILYAASGFGVNLLNLMMGSYLCSALIAGGFAQEVLPFQTYIGNDLVIPAIWAVFGFIAKLIDGIIDIPMAAFTDSLRSKFGRRRPSIIIGMIPMILSFLLFLVIPDKGGASVLNTVYYGVMLCIFYISYTLTMVTYYATFTEIVETEAERSLLSNAKSVYDIFYFIMGYVVVRAFLNGMNIRVVALLVLPLVLTMLIPIFMIKEPSSLDGHAGNTADSHVVNLTTSLRYTFKNRNFIIWMLVSAFMTFGVQLFLAGINEYFSYVHMSMILVMASSFAPVPFTLILYNYLQQKKGFGFAYRYILLVYTAGMLGMFAIGNFTDGTLKTVLSVVGGLISSFAIGALFAVSYSIPSQLAADEEEKTGVSHSAMYFAVQGLFSGIATGIAGSVVLTALKGSAQAASGAIRFMTLICAAGTFVAFLLSHFLPKSVTDIGKQDK